MASRNKCKLKDDLLNRLMTLNNKLNILSTSWLHSEQARAQAQEQRQELFAEIKLHRTKGHDGKPCPAVDHV